LEGFGYFGHLLAGIVRKGLLIAENAEIAEMKIAGM
jgi:hypothetical protein